MAFIDHLQGELASVLIGKSEFHLVAGKYRVLITAVSEVFGPVDWRQQSAVQEAIEQLCEKLDPVFGSGCADKIRLSVGEVVDMWRGTLQVRTNRGLGLLGRARSWFSSAAGIV